MWRWDQGRLGYYQFDTLKKVAKFSQSHDLRAVGSAAMLSATGLSFPPIRTDYPPWRNYSRIFKSMLVARLDASVAVPTTVAALLSQDGVVTTDEYFHFIAEATTEPSPAFDNWNASAEPRFPLLFTLKYLLAKAAAGDPNATMGKILDCYSGSGFSGEEDEGAFAVAISTTHPHWTGDARQPKESIRVLSQISYLHVSGSDVQVALDQTDARDLFHSLGGIPYPALAEGDEEIERRAAMFLSKIAALNFDYPHTIIGQTTEAGFEEGNKVYRTHLTIERNSKLRTEFFKAHPHAICDVCRLDTGKSYPWVDRVLDVHHLLPLSSGTRIESSGTVLADLVPNCPTCHRAVHRYYDQNLKSAGRKDFADETEARATYDKAKTDYVGPIHA